MMMVANRLKSRCTNAACIASVPSTPENPNAAMSAVIVVPMFAPIVNG